MPDYIKIEIPVTSSEMSDILLSALSDNKYYAFEEEENCLTAYISEEDFDEVRLMELLQTENFKKEIIKDENWNEQWESGFHPVIVNDFAAIRAAFHEPINNVKYDLLITPKMSFGTGHHATTFLMIEQMANIDFANKTVIDFGTGTGVLAILAEKLGAQKVAAFDNDQWSINNALENITANNCRNIVIEKRSTLDGVNEVDIVLANINLNVLSDASAAIASVTHRDSLLLTSGFLSKDEEEIEKIFTSKQFVKKGVSFKDGWLSVLFQKH